MRNLTVEEMKPKADFLLKAILKRGASDAVIVLSKDNALHIKFSNNRVCTTKSWESTQMDVFSVFNKKIVTTTVQDMKNQTIEETAARLKRFGETIEPNPEFMGIARGDFRYRNIKEGFDRKINRINGNAMDIVADAINTGLSNGAERTAGVFETSKVFSYLVTSGDINVQENATRFNFSFRSLCNTGASGHMISCSRMFDKLAHLECAAQSAKNAVLARSPVSIKAGKYSVIFSPLALSGLLDSVASSASIFDVESGLSYLKDRLGKRVAPESFTLYDDGRLRNGYNSTKCDEEGVPTKRKAIVREGILTTYLHNTSTAKRYRTETTGNAGLIAPAPFNVVVKEGSHSVEELMEERKELLYITNTWYMRFNNHLTGDFSTLPRDAIFLVKKGKILNSVTGIRVSDNMLRMLMGISAVGKDSRQTMGWDVHLPVTAPSILIDNVNITMPGV